MFLVCFRPVIEGFTFLQGLYIVVGIMLVVVLYHILFIVVDLRKILRRIEGVTGEVESMIMRPLGLFDHLITLLTEFLEAKAGGKKGKK